MQGIHFVTLRKLSVIADACFRKYVCSVTVWKQHSTWSKRCATQYYCVCCCDVFVCL